MRTTVDIPDEVYRELKGRAVRDGQTVKQLLLRGAESVLREPPKSAGRKLKFPLIDSDDPGSLQIDNHRIYELIDLP